MPIRYETKLERHVEYLEYNYKTKKLGRKENEELPHS